jgi:hypothetical protein
MKIRIGKLKRLIREAIEAETDSSSQKLRGVLFPPGSKKNTLTSIVTVALQEKDPLFGLATVAAAFVNTYKEELLRITDGGQVKYLGGGIVGDAYEFTSGDKKGMVLKMEPSWIPLGSGAPHKKMQDRIWGTDVRAETHPMIYDQGLIPLDKKECEVPGGSIKWAVLEKLELPHPDADLFMDRFIERCHRAIKEKQGVADAFASGIYNFTEEKLEGRVGEAVRVAELMRLNPALVSVDTADGKQIDIPRWCVDLFEAVRDALTDPDVKSDVHSGNIGLRRLGGTNVEWVFFD